MLGFSIGKNKIFFPETRDQKVTLLLCCSAIIFIFFLSCSKNFPRQLNVFLLVLIRFSNSLSKKIRKYEITFLTYKKIVLYSHEKSNPIVELIFKRDILNFLFSNYIVTLSTLIKIF